MRHKQKNLNVLLVVFSLLIMTMIGIALFTTFLAAPSFSATSAVDAVLWYLFSFVTGLATIVLPCTLPMLFVVVPLALKKGSERALGMILAFALGVLLVLPLYGIAAALFGGFAIDFFKLQSGAMLNWIYFFAGIFAYVLALGEIGLLNIRVPSYAGVAPKFIQKRKDHAKMFLLGIFLGNIGVGCAYPAVPLLLLNAGVSGSAMYGGLLFFVHGAGRVIPLILFAMLAVAGVNWLKPLLAKKEMIDRANGWGLLFVSAFILTLGLFSHQWFAQKGTLFAQFVGGAASEGSVVGIMGQPLAWANWVLILLWLIPLWWHYAREYKRVYGSALLQAHKLERQLDRLEEERRGLQIALHIPHGTQAERTRELMHKIDAIEKERRILEEGERYGISRDLRGDTRMGHEQEELRLRRNWYATLTVLLIIVFIVVI